MLASSLIAGIKKRGGTAELVQRDLRHAVCTDCGAYLTHHHVLNMNGPDYDAWLGDEDNSRNCPSGDPHTPAIEYEVVGELNGYDVHAYCQADYETGKQTCGHYTVRAISKRGEYDLYSDYNPGGYTFCDRVKSLDWACRLG